VISFSRKQIDGNQLVSLGVEDLHNLKVVKKLGHIIDIVMAVQAFKSRVNIIEQRSGNDTGCSVVGSQTGNILPELDSSPNKRRMEKLAILPISDIDQREKASADEQSGNNRITAQNSFVVQAPIENQMTTTCAVNLNDRNFPTQPSFPNRDGRQFFSAPVQVGG